LLGIFHGSETKGVERERERERERENEGGRKGGRERVRGHGQQTSCKLKVRRELRFGVL